VAPYTARPYEERIIYMTLDSPSSTARATFVAVLRPRRLTVGEGTRTTFPALPVRHPR